MWLELKKQGSVKMTRQVPKCNLVLVMQMTWNEKNAIATWKITSEPFSIPKSYQWKLANPLIGLKLETISISIVVDAHSSASE